MGLRSHRLSADLTLQPCVMAILHTHTHTDSFHSACFQYFIVVLDLVCRIELVQVKQGFENSRFI